MSLNSHDYDERQTVSLKDLSENGKEKLANLSDEELQQLKQQAVEAEDYDIAKMIKQEQTERKERLTESDDSQESDWQAQREEAWKNVHKKIQEEKNSSHEENLKKAEDLKNQLNDWEENNKEENNKDENNKDEKDKLAGLLGENQERYNTLDNDEKKKYRILFDVSKILDNYQESIKKYKEQLSRLDDIFKYWDHITESDWKENDRLEREAQRIVENLEGDINQYKRMYRTEIENTKMWQLFDELKNMFDKGLFKEKSYMWVLDNVVNVLQDLDEYTNDEKKFKWWFRH